MKTPLRLCSQDEGPGWERCETDEVEILDNLVELIVFTPRGSFLADPDFGFEYWNHEYAHVHFRNFNNGQNALHPAGGLYSEVTKSACQESIRRSIAAYEPRLRQVEVSIELKNSDPVRLSSRRRPKYEVDIEVTGLLDNGLGTARPYRKNVRFMMEPTERPIKI